MHMNTNSTSATEILAAAAKSAHEGLLQFETLLRHLSDVDLHRADTEGGGPLHNLCHTFISVACSGLPTLNACATSQRCLCFAKSSDTMLSERRPHHLRKRRNVLRAYDMLCMCVFQLLIRPLRTNS